MMRQEQIASTGDIQKTSLQINHLTFDDIWMSLKAGIQDFSKAPLYGLFFGAVYMIGGWLILASLLTLGLPYLAFPAATGFALIAPFIAAGLYEVSRRLEKNAPLNWQIVLGAIQNTAGRDMGWMALVTTFSLYFWVNIAGIIYLLFFGLNQIETTEFLQTIFTTPKGLSFFLCGSIVGGLIALTIFSLTVISFPLLIDRDLDFVTAMMTSVKSVIANPLVMSGWALMIVIAMFISFATCLIGFLFILPIAGHTTWQLYRRTITKTSA